jgi:hypothetical protein
MLLYNYSSAQDLNGVWKGTISEWTVGGRQISDDLEIQIIQTELSIKAFVSFSLFATGCDYGAELIKKTITSSECYSYNNTSTDDNFNSKGKYYYNLKKDFLEIKMGDCKQISCTIFDRDKTCFLANYQLAYSTYNGEEVLSGIMFKGKLDNFDTTSNGCNDGYNDVVFLKLSKETKYLSHAQSFFINKNSLEAIPITKSPFFLNFEKSGISSLKPVLLTNETKLPVAIETRKNEKLKTIKVKTKQVELSIYDYGRIDHDIVSVYVDKKPILVKEELTRKPLIVNLEMDKNNNYHEVILVAENLGDIPPNTALMKIKAGNETHEVKITSDEQKNAVIVFKYKE